MTFESQRVEAVDERRGAGRKILNGKDEIERHFARRPAFAAAGDVGVDAGAHLVIAGLGSGDVGPRSRRAGNQLLAVAAFAGAGAAEDQRQAGRETSLSWVQWSSWSRDLGPVFIRLCLTGLVRQGYLKERRCAVWR